MASDSPSDERANDERANDERADAPPPATAARPALSSYRSIDPDRVVETLSLLHKRIEDRFPSRGLGRVCEELTIIAQEAKARAEALSKPIRSLRLLSAALAVVMVGASVAVFFTARLPSQTIDIAELIQLLEAGINDVVLIGAAIFFLATIEKRIKRGRALAAIHELRAIAHIIDLHQLTKDPERAFHRLPPVASSPVEQMSAFQLNRYLDYCSELLSLAGKVAALYVQEYNDEVALAAVNEVEDLCTGLSRKIWQKIMIVESLASNEARPG